MAHEEREPVVEARGDLAATAAISVVAVNLKLPPFWPADPELWFAQVEAQFACRRISAQKAKFDHVVSSLTPEFASEVRDLLLNPPADTPYDVLREQLTRRTAASEQRKLQQLFTTEELGDRKPTQLLRRMQQLRSGVLTDGSFLQEFFLQRLPHNVRMVLASTPDTTSLDKLAELADKIMEVAAPPPPSVASATTPIVAGVNTPAPLAAEVEHLRSEVTRLGSLVQQLGRSRSSSRPASRPSRRSPTPTRSTRNDSYCWYHTTFGDRAQRCRSPCNWSGNDQAGH